MRSEMQRRTCNMSRKFCFSSYVATLDELRVAVEAGIDHLILEDSKLSVRCFENHFDEPSYINLEMLCKEARRLKEDISLSVNCDGLYHNDDFTKLHILIPILKALNILEIRVQDLGVLLFFRQYFPEAKIIFNLEIGNHNTLAVKEIVGNAQGQVLANEAPLKTLQDMVLSLRETTSDYHCELQVQGLLLLQYSWRRYMAGLLGLEADASCSIIKKAQDNDYPGRIFTFLDNPHGHFMLSYFDRCLFRYIPDLMSLNLDRWLFDLRGYKPDQQKAVFILFRQEKDRYLRDPVHYKIDEESWLALEKSSPRPLKVGFFRANHTDRERRKYPTDLEGFDQIGQVLDSEKEKWVVIECFETLYPTEQCLALTAEGKEIKLSLTGMQSLEGESLTASHSHRLIRLPWQKGLKTKLPVYRVSS